MLVRTLFTGISRGSESLVFRGEVPESEYQRMRAPFQTGNFPSPVKYGYINVGVVEKGPPALLDKTVFCLYPHQTVFHAPVASVFPLPDGVPPQRAILAANLETAINGLWDATPRVGDRVAVVGAGTLGCLMAWLLARIPGLGVELIDVNEDKRSVAQTLGAGFASPDDAAPEADLVIHCSASESGLNTALELAGIEARIIEMSWYGQRPDLITVGRSISCQTAVDSLLTGWDGGEPAAPALEYPTTHGAGPRTARRARSRSAHNRGRLF